MNIYVYIQVGLEARDWHWVLSFVALHLNYWFRVFHLNPELPKSSSLATQLVPGFCLSLSCMLGLQMGCYAHQGFTWMLGIQTLVLILPQQALYMTSRLSSLSNGIYWIIWSQILEQDHFGYLMLLMCFFDEGLLVHICSVLSKCFSLSIVVVPHFIGLLLCQYFFPFA